MSDFKSKLPDLTEVGSMAHKLFKDVKQSVSEIITDYKAKRAEQEAQQQKTSSEETKKESTPKKDADKKDADKKSQKNKGDEQK